MNELKATAVRSLGSKSGLIVEAAKTGLSDDQLLALPMDNSLKRIIQRARKPIGASTVDKPLDEIVWADCFIKTQQGELFLLYDSRYRFNWDTSVILVKFRIHEPGKPIFFIFMSPLGLRLLRENLHWAIDGTFFCSPLLFYQLYTINVFYGKFFIPSLNKKSIPN